LQISQIDIEKIISIVQNNRKIERDSKRFVSIPRTAMGTLRQDLINTLGVDRTKGFLMRYGWNCGASDANEVKQKKWNSPRDLVLEGTRMCTMRGYGLIEPLKVSLDLKNSEGICKNSYEAEEHIKYFGYSDSFVCHTLIGYASGYLSTITGEKIIAKEAQCSGRGDEHCYWVAKPVEEWGDDIKEYLTYFEEENLAQELDQAYQNLKIKLDIFNKGYLVQQQLMQTVLWEEDLNSIAQTVFNSTQVPVLIEDSHFKPIAFAGINFEIAQMYSRSLNDCFFERDEKGLNKLNWSNPIEEIPISNHCLRLITPIRVRQHIVGYASFISEGSPFEESDYFILGQTSLASSLHFLNEHVRLDAELRTRGDFLEEILSQKISLQEILNRAQYIEFNLQGSYSILTLDKQEIHGNEEESYKLTDELVKSLSAFFKEREINVLIGKKLGCVVILLSDTKIVEKNENINRLCQEIIDYCRYLNSKYHYKLGVSSESTSILEASDLYEESLAALKVANEQKNIISFCSLGIVGILFQSKNKKGIRKFSNKLLGKLLEEDQDRNMELTTTLYHYLNNGCNAQKTAKATNFSITGMRYRLKRINELLSVDFNEPGVSYQLYLAIQSLIVLGDLEIQQIENLSTK
jgi:sugar diacid utilization regulator